MSPRLDYKTATAYLDKYFSTLKSVGYVRHSMVMRFVIYTFLIDFIDVMAEYISEADYWLIDEMLNRLFSSGNCLLPYDVFCNGKIKVAKPIENQAFPVDTVNHYIVE